MAIKKDERKVESFRRKSQEVLEDIVRQINVRFEGFASDPVLLAADILDPANYPVCKEGNPGDLQQEAEEFAKYGVDHVRVLVNRFRVILELKGCDLERVETEWLRLKYDINRFHKKESVQSMWEKILTQKAHKFPNVLHIIRILLVLPVATAQVERSFSYLKRFLGDWRHSLNCDTIEDLLRIAAEGPEPAMYDPKGAVNRWRAASVRSRRPTIMPYGPRKKTPTLNPAVSAASKEPIEIVDSSSGNEQDSDDDDDLRVVFVSED